MKKRIIRIWGVGLIVALLASMLLMPTTSSARELGWSDEVIPGPPNETLQSDNVTDIAVAADGETIWASPGTGASGTIVFKSTDGGVTWTSVNTTAGGMAGIKPKLVAIAPDNSDYVAIASDNTVYITTNAGTTFSDLSVPQEGSNAACANITDMDLSAEAAGKNVIVVSGTENATVANVWYYKLGIGGVWKETNPSDGTNQVSKAYAVAASPNFASDEVFTAVTGNGTHTLFNMCSLSGPVAQWNNTAGFTGYPVILKNTTSVPVVATGASISLAPTYLGSDDVERVALVGIQEATSGDAGVYRLKNIECKQIKTDAQIYSVAYDGTTLLAGIQNGTTVWRSSNPLDTSPDFYPSAATKSPSGARNTVVGWAGTNAVAGTTGNENAFAVSINDGESFSDLSLIATTIANIQDAVVAADGSVVYMLTDDGTDTSLWRSASSWQRVLSLTNNLAYIVRIDVNNPDTVYVADTDNSTTLYYSKTGGTEKWYNRAKKQVADLAVESEDIAYYATGASVTKTLNGGFTWKPAELTKLVAGDVATITSLGEDMLVVGSTQGYVSYSTDGNASWTKIPQQTSAGNCQVTGSGLETGDYLYAGTDLNTALYRWEVGQAGSIPWKGMEAPTLTGEGVTGIALWGGVLYASTSNGTTASAVMRTLAPTIPDPDIIHWSTLTASSTTANITFTATPSALRVSTGSTKLWAASKDPNNVKLYSYDDTMADVGPNQVSPADGTQVKINEITGASYDVSFTWSRISKAKIYDLWISYDSDFDEVAIRAQTTSTPAGTVSLIVGPTGTQTLNYMPGTTYYWRVRAASDGPIFSQWSGVRSFSIEATGAVAPQIGSPANGATIPSVNPAFSWSPVSGATKYEFQLAVGTNFAAALHAEQLSETGIRPAVKLDPGMTYFWRVRAIEPVLGAWSTIANFTVAEPEEAPPPPVVVEQVPPPQINIPAAPPAQVIQLPEAPAPPAQIAPGYIWAIIIIGAVLVIAVIVLIVRTRRSV